MCGFVGFVEQKPSRNAGELESLVRRLAVEIEHRGPDDAGEWCEPAVALALGFRRLSIVDLSPAGHQPMRSVSGRFTIAFNGEVYNYERVREELLKEGLAPSFRGHSDTEVMLAAFEAWGVERSLLKFVGMFAFAVWDASERRLYLVRDRVGVKPLYYGWTGEAFLFGSELKALRRHPSFDGQIDRDALALYMRHNYIPAPRTIYKRFHKLQPGHFLIFRPSAPHDVETRTYWSPTEVARRGIAHPFSGSDSEALDALNEVLSDSVALRMVADVPVGVFLSGGIDSSIVTALMQAQSSRPIKTFSIGFHEEGFDEAVHAREVARHLGTDHTELYVPAEQALAVIPKLPEIFDEPFADSSQIPTYLVSQLARRRVTVSLSGDGGDELFGGYTRYTWASRIWRKTSWLPRLARKGIAGGLGVMNEYAWDRTLATAQRAFPKRFRVTNPGRKLEKMREILRLRTPDEIYLKLVSHWDTPSSLVLGSSEPDTPLTLSRTAPLLPRFTERMMLLDLLTYLPDDILVKVDRASMAVSLEAREPLLDHRLIEFAWSLPMHMKIRDGEGKWLLRQLLYKHVPKELIDRPKMGFGIPLDSWLRGPLREWAEALLDSRRLESEGYLAVDPIRERWDEHRSGKANWHYPLWNVLMFQAWLEQQRNVSSTSAEPAPINVGV